MLSGLIGLGSRYLTSDESEHQYGPIVTTMIENDLLEDPIFSIALQWSSDHSSWNVPGGYIAFGGLPPVRVVLEYVTTDLVKVSKKDPGGLQRFVFL